MIYSAPPDPYELTVYVSGGVVYPDNSDTSALTWRPTVIDPTKRTLILITAGQSQLTNVNPTLYVPTNASVIHNFNIKDGASYSPTGALVGCSSNGLTRPGNVCLRIADLLVTNGKFDVVYLVPIAVTGSLISEWSVGPMSSPGANGRFGVAMKRLAAAGITPGMTNVTFAILWGQGEGDGVIGTTSANWQSSFATLKATILATGFVGRIFVNVETWDLGVPSATIQAAQAAVVDSVTVFAGANWDTLNNTFRQADQAHFNDAGAAAAAPLVYTAMHATGAPF